MIACLHITVIYSSLLISPQSSEQGLWLTAISHISYHNQVAAEYVFFAGLVMGR